MGLFNKHNQENTPQPDERNHLVLTIEQVHNLFESGIMGTLEFRQWLANRSPEFRAVRDSELDEHIHRLAQQRSAMFNEEDDGRSDS